MVPLVRLSCAAVAVLGVSFTQDAMTQAAKAQAPAQPAQAQPPVPAPVQGNVYSVTYVEVMPTAKAAAVRLLKTYRDATRQEDGNVRCEVVERIGAGHQFVILEVWKDQQAFEAHGKGASLALTREKIAAIRNAPTDERVHAGLSVGPLDQKPPRGAFYVVTHVDVIPPQKDTGIAAVKALGDDSRKQNGNVRFDVAQQANRGNHFTVMEVWKDEMSAHNHGMTDVARTFRDKLGPITGALYDERTYRAVN
jgi:quinol monooxygenase YgiN